MPGIRHKARVIAFQTLFEIDSVGHLPPDTLARHLDDANLTPEASAFVEELVSGALKYREKIDKAIQESAPSWPIDQMPKVDKNILRLAIFEILFHNKVPLKVAINEAVELAKTFGSDNSAKFINGVLGTVTARATQ